MKQLSIQKTLVNSISVVFGVILFIAYITVVFSLNPWMDQQFDDLDDMLYLLDALLVFTFLMALFVLRSIAIKIVVRGLKPLKQLNEEISQLDIENTKPLPSHSNYNVEEIEPIRRELNKFIQNNQLFIQNEKRLTGDIAHELKTPIAEILALTEVSIGYPDDPRISETYKNDILKIGQRMQQIVDNLLLLQSASSNHTAINIVEIEANAVVNDVLQSLSFKYPEIRQRVMLEIEVSHFAYDNFSFAIILTNLLDNALFYSPENSLVSLSLKRLSKQHQLCIKNIVASPIEPSQLEHILEPMYQIDCSRTVKERHGLGLSIVKQLCEKNRTTVDINYDENTKEIIFTLSF